MRSLCLCLFAFLASAHSIVLAGQNSITQYGITWTFAQEHEVGQYITGDYWVVGPVTITSITNNAHTHGFRPELGHDGSMVNPKPTAAQGYDKRLNSYRAKLNAALPNGKPISAANPLKLQPHSSLISTVSWLAKSNTEKEPGAPRYNGGTKAPRPVLRDAAILTVVDKAPEAGSFRPPYCGDNKTSGYNVNRIKRDVLFTIKPVGKNYGKYLPKLAKRVSRPWLDHGHQYLGAMFHPTNNMPEYGRDLSMLVGTMALALTLDWEGLPYKDDKEKLLIGFLQLGIDLGEIIKQGGSYPSNGGHHMGRKYPILYAGKVFGDESLLNIGTLKNLFQEDLDTFYVSQADITMTASKSWKPDKRAKKLAYTEAMIGLPEWGIRHVKDPWADNAHWSATYRSINNQAYTGWTLAAHINGLKQYWHHDPLFDYVDRVVAHGSHGAEKGSKRYIPMTFGNAFVADMWKAYRNTYGCRWKPKKRDIYATGELVCEGCQFNCTSK